EITKGSVCVSCIATVGQVVIASEECHTNQQINSIVPANKEHSSYLYFCMLGKKKALHDLASGGSATLNLNTGSFSKVPLICPGDKSLSAFSRVVESMFESILENDRQSKVLSEIRDTLLPKLLSGEIVIKNTQSTEETAA
ncbi:MAG: restriction endonuclease subunit S, partial [Nitrospiria bacterium]